MSIDTHMQVAVVDSGIVVFNVGIRITSKVRIRDTNKLLLLFPASSG